MAGASFPITAVTPILTQIHAAVCEADRPTLDGLKKAGFKNSGEGGPGLFMKYWKDGGVSARFPSLT